MSAFNDLKEILETANASTGMEAIEFQVDTKFADSIRDIYQDIINYREVQRGNKNIVKLVLEYAKKKIQDEFPKLWKQHLGVELKTITFSSNISFLFAMQPVLGNNTTLGKIIDSMTGNTLYAKNINFSKNTLEEIKKISMSFDRTKGKITATSFLKKNISMNFFFDPYIAFLMRDTLHVNLDYMTAEEITGITLHEVGHMMSLLEHCGDLFYQVSLNVAIIKSFAKTAPLSEKVKLTKEMLKKQTDTNTALAENSMLGQKEANNAVTAVKNITDSFDANRDDNWNDSSLNFWETICSFFVNIFFIGMSSLSFIYNPIRFMIESMVILLIPSFVGNYVQKGGPNNPKYSDFMANKTNAFNWERWADEYVTRYGYGSSLSSALVKLFNAMNHSSLFANTNEKGMDTWIRNSSIPFYLNYVCNFFWAISTGGNMDDGFGIYETQVHRMNRIIEDTASVFKRTDLPQEVTDLYLLEFEKCQAQLNNVPTLRRCEHLFGITTRCIMSFVNPIELGNRIFRANIKSEYATLANDIDKLQSNQLFYEAAKLNSILANRK